jgi:ABC-2 type transport system permease protein
MTTYVIPSRARPPARGFRKLVTVEGKLALRVPFGLALGVLVPVILLVIFNAIPAMKKPAPGSTLTLFAEYFPVLICMSLGLIALLSLPIPLVTNRQMGVLRRFATTPAPQSWLLAAQVIINLALALMAIVVLTAGAVLFGVHLAPQIAGFALSAALATAALFAIGLLIAAVVPSTPIAGVVGTVLLYPMWFFAGLWGSQQNMSPLLQHIGNFTPLGSAVQAMDHAMQGTFPPARPLLVMAAYAIVFGIAALKLFRWE